MHINKKPVIDISWWQDPTKIDYDKLANQIDGAIIRIGFSSTSDGKPKEDNRFCTHYDELTKRGVPVGGYWYSTATSKPEIIAEVTETLRVIDGLAFDFPIAWDTEDPRQATCSKELLTELADTYCRMMEQAGYYVVIYSYAWWLNNRLQMDKLKAYDVWVAALADKPEYDKPYGMWQYTWTLNLDGYAGPLDGNRVYKDYPAIMQRLSLNGCAPIPLDEIAARVIQGEFGNGAERAEKLRRIHQDPAVVQAKVNEILAIPKLLPVKDIATRVIQGLYGNGKARLDKLSTEGYDAATVQAEVNRLLN